MALIGCRSEASSSADQARIAALAPRPHVWCEPRRHGGRAVLAAVADNAIFSPHTPVIAAGEATDGAGRGLAFTGRLFDPSGFARRHGLAPHRSEAELIAAWLERHAPQDMAQALAALDGDYALARWDPMAATLLLATAPMATRTLYWHHSEHGTWFASSLALLFRFPAVPRTPSPTNVAAHLSALVLDPADTVFERIRQLPQGTALWADQRGAREETVWRPDPTRRLRLRRDEDYVEAGRELLAQAVRHRVQGERPPAIALSGGLDSAATAATAALLLKPTPIDTYTAVPPPGPLPTPAPGFYASERPAVEELALRHPNLRPRFCHSDTPASFEYDPTPLFLACGRSVTMASHLGWFDPMYRAIRADGHNCVLMSNAGNFTLSFDDLPAFADLLRSGRLALLLRLFPQVMRYQGKQPLRRLRPLFAQTWPDLRRLLRRWRGLAPDWQSISPVRPDAIQALELERHTERWDEAGIQARSPDSRVQRAHFLHKRWTRQNETLTALRSYYGLDFMDPLGDRALVEFCLAIPPEQYVLDGRSRSLGRRILADRLPAAQVNEPRRGQQKPEWYQRLCLQKEAFAADLERMERSPLAASLIDVPRLKAMLAQWPADADAAQARRFEYESMLPRAVNMGHFLRWIDGGNQ